MIIFPGAAGAINTPPGVFQLGGPPNPVTLPWTRPMPQSGKAYVAHLYDNAWNFKRTLGPLLNRPTIEWGINGGYQPITLELPYTVDTAAIWGNFIWGQTVYGSVVQQGDIVALTEQGGDRSIVVSGVIEVLSTYVEAPDASSFTTSTVSVSQSSSSHQSKVSHHIQITPWVGELGDVGVGITYATPVDIAQMVRDVVNMTRHCRYTPASVPDTGIQMTAAFTSTNGTDAMNTLRLMAGVNYLWFVDAMGTVWFQPMATQPQYTAKRGADFNSYQATPSIAQLKNYIQVVGGVPDGGSAVATGLYSNATSQQQYGPRAFDPPPSYPSITDPITLQAIAATLGAAFDRVVTNIDIAIPHYASRVTPNQPGGAVVQLWTPTQAAMVESETGTGQYSAPYAVLHNKMDAPYQTLSLGDLPYSSLNDFQYIVSRIAQRAGVQPLAAPPLSTNTQTTLAGGGTGTVVPATAPHQQQAPGWYYNQNGVFATDGTYNRVQIGDLASYTDSKGVNSPAEWGVRTLDAGGNIIFDTLGVIGVASLLGQETLATATAAGSGTGFSTVQTIPGSGVAFTLNRTGNILCLSFCMAGSVAGASNYMAVYQGIWQGATLIARKLVGVGATWTTTPYQFVFGSSTFLNLPAGAYTFRQEFALDASTTSVTFGGFSGAVEAYAEVLRLGG